ncbi:abscisic aldehyde oxidase 3 [Artemisia annua]|uniref:Abscisic aldehyde oxidase 3 n=1 Tax=Artemisia annua TaxID=35608 RepID=A0A2U1P2X4_ARTAN|nr:abscisic aldehyde oxidase 3 [Artemisia annua]
MCIAEIAIIDYNTEDLEPPILTVEQAVERSSFFDVPSMFYPSPVGDFAKGMAEADLQTVEQAVERSSFREVPSMLYPSQVGDFAKGMAEADHQIHSAEIRLPSQKYFYIETQTALAIPDEDNCMVVYSSIEVPGRKVTNGVWTCCFDEWIAQKEKQQRQKKNQEKHKYEAGAGRDENTKGSKSPTKDNRKNEEKHEAQPESNPKRDQRIAIPYQNKAPMFKRVSGLSEPVVTKSQEIAEDMRERWETSDHAVN